MSKENTDNLPPIQVKLRRVIHVLETPELCMRLSGVSVTKILPDGSEREEVFCDEFTDQDILETVFRRFDLSYSPGMKIEKAHRRTVIYHPEPSKVV